MNCFINARKLEVLFYLKSHLLKHDKEKLYYIFHGKFAIYLMEYY